MSIGRRQLLTVGAAFGVERALQVASAAAAKKGPTPEELSPTLEYFHHATEGFVTNEKGETAFTTRMEAGDIYVFFAQKLGLPQATEHPYEVDSTNHPEEGMVIALVAHRVITEPHVSNLKFVTYPGRYVWKTRERTKLVTHKGRIEDAVRAGEVQVSRSRIPGNCTKDGCTKTQLVVLLGHEEMNAEGKVEMRFDEVGNESYEK